MSQYNNSMYENLNRRRGTKSTWTILILIILVGGIAGGGTYVYFNNKALKEKTDLQNQINNLNDQTKKLNAENASLKNANKTNNDSGTSTKTTLNTGIEKVDFSKIIEVNTTLGDQLQKPTYADLNGDNSEEALVVYQYAGTGAAIDLYIYGIKNGNPVQLFKETNLSYGSATIKDNSVYVDYANLNSALNKDKINSDITADTHVKYTWDGSTFAKINQ